MSNAVPNAATALLIGAGPAAAVSLGGGCVLGVPLPIPLVVAAGSTSAQGGWSFALPIGTSRLNAGALLAVQAFVQVGGGPVLGAGDLSNTVELTFGL